MSLLLNQEVYAGGYYGENVKEESYELTIDSRFGAKVSPGNGVNMSKPFYPVVSLFCPFSDFDRVANDNSKKNQGADVISIQSVLRYNLKDEEEYEVLRTNFNASYKFASAEAINKFISNSKKKGERLYFLYSIEGENINLPNNKIKWDEDDLATMNQETDIETLKHMFVQKYGSHFIRSITYGTKISIRALVMNNSREKDKGLYGKVKAVLGAIGTKGEVSKEVKEAVKNGEIEITIDVLTGGIKDVDDLTKDLSQTVILRDLDEVNTFLRKIAERKILITYCPVKANIQNYWSLIDKTKYPNISKALIPIGLEKTLLKDSSVPSNTIIEWAVIVKKGAEDRAVAFPDGWVKLNEIERFDNDNVTEVIIYRIMKM